MKVLFVPLAGPLVVCSRVRIYQYLPFLAARGVEPRVIPFFPRTGGAGSPPGDGVARWLADAAQRLRRVLYLRAVAPRYDVVLLQRVLLPVGLQRLLSGRARRLIFDFDDAIYTSHRGGASRPAAWLGRERTRFAHVLRASDAATVSTPYLAARARRYQPNTFEVVSPVDCERYRPRDRAETSDVVVGWIGNPSTTMYLQSLIPLCRRLVARYSNVRFEFVGADRRVELGPARVRGWTLDSELKHLQAFDIGIMPLTDDEWSRGKAGYKLLQYMACGTACVASPVGFNLELIRHGETGLLAGDEAEWEQALVTLIEDVSLRRRLGTAGLEQVRREYSLRAWAPRFHAALEAVAGLHRA